MSDRFLSAVFSVIAVVLLAPLAAFGQAAADDWTLPRTPDGVPDIQGLFTFRTITPLQRPKELAGKQTLTAEEAADYEAYRNRRLNRDLFDPITGAPWAGYAPRAEGGVLSYNEFWYERGVELTKDKRTSLVVDPPDGRIPFTEEARARRVERRAKLNAGFADSYTDRSLSDRCIMGFNSGPPMVSGAYNNNVLILQVPGYVVILNEMVHNTRIIPTDGRPHVNLRQWAGDSRGRWEGDTLVIETRNFDAKRRWRNTTESMRLVERLTRVDAETLVYEFTVTDQETWTSPWTASVPMVLNPEPMYEYACHEGNYGMTNLLTGARVQEKE
jgi:hypothetical protein